MNTSVFQFGLSMFVYIAFLLLVVEVMRKNYKLALAFWLISLLTFPLWSTQLVGWFRWAKTLSVLIPTAIFVGFGRFSHIQQRTDWMKFFRKDWLLWVLYGVLFLNIAEATMKDFTSGNYFNAISGVILCITIPFLKFPKSKKRFWGIENKKQGDLVVYTSAAWNFLYTTWNLAFVYGENASFFASSFCILFAAELYPILKRRPELYVTARVYTLAIHILIRSTYDIFAPVMDSGAWANDKVLYSWGLINVILHIPFLFWYIYKYYLKEGPTQSFKPQLA